MKIYFTLIIFIGTFCSLLNTTKAEEINNRPPNIVFFFADDLGYGDLASYGHPYAKTPSLDQLASEGTRFTQHYVTGVTCISSRSGLMSGLFPARFQKDTHAYGFGDRKTISQILKENGYKTGHFGKWDIGPEIKNGTYGFDEIGKNRIKRSKYTGRDDRLTQAAINFITENKDRPFYINIWGHATHFPVNPSKELASQFTEVRVKREDFGTHMHTKLDESQAINPDLDNSMRQYLGDVLGIDRNIGRLMKVIDEIGIADNTIFVFSSDNGPAPITSNANLGSRPYSENMLGYAGGLKGGKHNQYEGGVRVPFIIRWPGHIPAGRVNDTSITSFIDWMPSLAAIAGASSSLPEILDGEDISDIWKGASRDRQKPLFWKKSSAASPAMRQGKWKLHLATRKKKDVTQLYDLSIDPFENNNLAGLRPEVTRAMAGELRKFLGELPETWEN